MEWNVVLIGITVVFSALILLSLFIKIFSSLVNNSAKNKVDKTTTTEEPMDIESKDESVQPEPSLNDVNDDEIPEGDLVAILTAAVQASIRVTPECKLVVKSYKRVNKTTPVWNRTSRERLLS